MNDPIFSVAGKVCLVTGASSGLGGHFARVLMARGAHVIGASRTAPDWSLEDATGSFVHLECDVTDRARLQSVVDHIEARHGSLDVLINNAGECIVAKLGAVEKPDLMSMFDVNVAAVAECSALCSQLMKEAGGSIINVSSVMANATMAGLAGYSASKAALDQIGRGQAVEWARWNIRVNMLSPGWFPSKMTEPYLARGVGGVLTTRIPQKRLGEMGDLDGALLLLASDASRYMTGMNLKVDGGFGLIN